MFLGFGGNMNKKLVFLILSIFVFFVPFASAIIGSIGNAKAIVNVDLNKNNILERTVLIKNVNNFSIDVKLEPADDLEKITDIIDKEFTLKENEEKNARFKVTIPKEGVYNGNIVIFFKPEGGRGAGVVLQSNLIIKASGDKEVIVNDLENKDNDIDNENIDNNDDNENINSNIENEPSKSKIGFYLIIGIIFVSLVIIAIFVILMRRI